MESLGILFSLGAALSWGLGDYLIQRGSRQYGIVETLLFIGAFGAVALLPFAWGSLGDLLIPGVLALLAVTFLITLLAALVDFRALRDGKLAVIEPVISLELPIVVLIGVFILGERLSSWQLLAISVAFIAILLAVSKRRVSFTAERGALLAFFGAILLALTDVFTGLASQQTSAVLTMWVVNVGLAASSCVMLLAQRRGSSLASAIRHHPRLVLGQALFDNAGWLFFAAAAALIPISIALTISESYVLISVLLGIFMNRERLAHHQYAGVAIGFAAIICLALVS